MFERPYSRFAIGSHLWRSFITASYVVGVLLWTANDTGPRTMDLALCVYGRCPTVPVTDAIRPTLAVVVALAFAAVLVAWGVPIVVEDRKAGSKGDSQSSESAADSPLVSNRPFDLDSFADLVTPILAASPRASAASP
jgi:hypothetical protein